MKVTINIMPRQVGKTSIIASNFFINTVNQCILVNNIHQVNEYNNLYGIYNVFTVDYVIRPVKEKMTNRPKIHTIYIDEYLFINDKYKKDVYSYLQYLESKLEDELNVIIYTTSNKLYNIDILQISCDLKKSKNYKTLETFKSILKESDYNELKSLEYNLLTEPNVIINNYIRYSNDENIKHIDPIFYDTECLGKFLFDKSYKPIYNMVIKTGVV